MNTTAMIAFEVTTLRDLERALTSCLQMTTIREDSLVYEPAIVVTGILVDLTIVSESDVREAYGDVPTVLQTAYARVGETVPDAHALCDRVLRLIRPGYSDYLRRDRRLTSRMDDRVLLTDFAYVSHVQSTMEWALWSDVVVPPAWLLRTYQGK